MILFNAFIALFVMSFLMVLIFLLLNTSETYVKLASQWSIVLGLTLLLKIPVRFLRRISPPHHLITWNIERNPPDWLLEEVIQAKNRISWEDRARFWYLILSYGTKSVHKIVGPKFLPHLFAQFFRITLRRMKNILIDFNRSTTLFSRNPIISYLHFAGSISGGALNWIFESVYRTPFVEAMKDAARKFGHHEALQLKSTGLYHGNSVKTLMSMIMYIYVVYGLVSWMRYCYPSVEPIVEATDEYSIVRFCQGPFECPHRGLKYPAFCKSFVTWEAALAETINPNLTAFASKRAIAGDEGCEVTVLFKHKLKE
ncbi:MAG: hypothetical protein HWN66_16545 [Candidatus Helarchaeota archaeon]|nr:hypothetical protein [Candidatus Helarchaeota archaeon]